MEIDILSSFKSMGVRAESLNGEERLKILHDVLNPNKTFEFSYKDLKKKESTKTYIAPDEFNFTPSRYFKFEILSEQQVIFKFLQVSFQIVCCQSFGYR